MARNDIAIISDPEHCAALGNLLDRHEALKAALDEARMQTYHAKARETQVLRELNQVGRECAEMCDHLGVKIYQALRLERA